MIDRYFCQVTRSGAVATLRFTDRASLPPGAAGTEPHWEFAEVLWELAFDDDIRVIVQRGCDSQTFLTPVNPKSGEAAGPLPRDPHWLWRASAGIIRAHYAFALLDKPVVACVQGDAINVGSSYLFAADIVVADEDVRIADNHMGMGDVQPFPWRLGIVPGDGGAALIPLFMAPTLAKEYLMLARPFTAAELCDRGLIARAVPASQVEATLAEVVADLLARPPRALAWAKQQASKQILDQLTGVADAGIGYQMVNMLQFAADETDHRQL